MATADRTAPDLPASTARAAKGHRCSSPSRHIPKEPAVAMMRRHRGNCPVRNPRRPECNFECTSDNDEINDQRPVLEIVEIEADALIPREIRSATYLPETSDARLYVKSAICGAVALLDLPRPIR